MVSLNTEGEFLNGKTTTITNEVGTKADVLAPIVSFYTAVATPEMELVAWEWVEAKSISQVILIIQETKRQASKKVRRYYDLTDGKLFRKVYNSWNIFDYKGMWFSDMRYYTEYKAYQK